MSYDPTVQDDDHPLLPHLPLVERIVAALARRRRLPEQEAEEFAAEVRLILVEDRGGVLTSFQGKSSWKTYLTTVVSNLYLDWQRSRWGRWRPAAVAKRLGPVAILLDRMLHRDGLSFEEAAEMLRRNHGVDMAIPELAELAGKLPHRPPRRTEGGEAVDHLVAPGAADSSAHQAEQGIVAQRVEDAVNAVLTEMAPADRLLLQLLYESGLQVSAVARMLDEDQKSLYRRRDRLLARLRQGLEARGVTWCEVEYLFARGSVELGVEYATGGRTASEDPTPPASGT